MAVHTTRATARDTTRHTDHDDKVRHRDDIRETTGPTDDCVRRGK